MSGERVGIIGVGLIGGSLALALKEAGDSKVVACDPGASAAVVKRCVDRWYDSPSELVKECDVVVLATPVKTAELLLAEIAAECPAQTVLTDVGSTKQAFVQTAYKVLGRESITRLVPGHPITGSEKNTAANAHAGLFQGRKVALTPSVDTAAVALTAVTRLWQRVGAEVVQMGAMEHDELFAVTSHLPHVLAYALIGGLLASAHRDDAVEYAAGGLRDFTRIAESDSVMWRDICLTNREFLLKAMAGFEVEFKSLSDAIARSDGEALAVFFKRAGEYRRRFSA